ncbi:MAG: hypothetical protein LBK73_13315 [Treponema sp.]|jgi:hypothetical protein|nr:hypothetical protein [Treponema sp.]
MAQGKRFDMADECDGLDFHAIRLENRFVRTMETLMKQPDASIWYSGPLVHINFRRIAFPLRTTRR